MYKKDWIIDQIESFIDVIDKVFLHKDSPSYELGKEKTSTEDSFYIELDNLIQKRKINEAENLLFDKIDPANSKHLSIAVNFYSKLNQLNDETLEKANYSRQEIDQGLKDIMKEFGIKIELV